jgi:hypothetical protein
MTVRFHIFPEHYLVYVQYRGVMRISESLEAFSTYAAHPQARPGQKQLVDLSRVTDFEADYAEVMKMQMKKAEVFVQGPHQTMIAYVAPSKMTLKISRLVISSWEPINGVEARVLQSTSEALHVLGVRSLTAEDLDTVMA